jgi:catechol 2,3-dioxygenase-like lactoylglutathione lyase family enzyme
MPRLTYARLLVADFPTAFRFYRDALGLTSTFGNENDVYADFDTGSATLALFRRDFMAGAVGTTGKPVEADCQDKIALIFEVEDVDATYEQLQAKGVSFVTVPQDRVEWGIRTAHFRDPDGNLLEIYTPLSSNQ